MLPNVPLQICNVSLHKWVNIGGFESKSWTQSIRFACVLSTFAIL